MKSFFKPSANLINIEKLKNVPASYFINESYLLYDKSDLVKETFLTALQKNL